MVFYAESCNSEKFGVTPFLRRLGDITAVGSNLKITRPQIVISNVIKQRNPRMLDLIN